MVDLTTTYLGLQLKNPLVASSSPLTQKLESVLKMEDAGIAAVVLHSLFEEQIIHESLKMDRDMTRGTESFAESLTYLPDFGQYTIGPDSYVDTLAKIKRATGIPVIGSLNGISTGGWVDYAQRIEAAGADALELNIYDITTSLSVTSAEMEDAHVKLVEEVCKQVKVPVAVKLSPFYTALPSFASRLVNAGAKGLVLFNRFYQPDFDLEALEVVPHLVLSNSNEMRLPLRWIAILYGRVGCDFGLTSGVHSTSDVIKGVMAGASVTMLASALLTGGIGLIPTLVDELKTWLVDHEYESVTQMKGSMSAKKGPTPQSFERANYMKVLSSY